MRENADGSILLEPTHVDADSQARDDETPELQELLARAMSSRTVRRRRVRV